MQSLQKVCDAVTHLLLAIGASVLSAMMFLTTADVILRYFFESPLPGTYEILQYMMSIVIPFGIAYCAHEDAHVSVDILFASLPRRIQSFLQCVNSLIVLLLFLLIAWQSISYVQETYESGLTSGILYIPSYPFVGAMALGFSTLCLVLLLDFIRALSKSMGLGDSPKNLETVEK
jgi:TRAP-type C4-dicarboxylate transport system permease small subunit